MVIGAVGVWLGFPLADPIIGLLITLAIFAIVWQSAKAIFTRLLDGVEPQVVDDIRHAVEHISAVQAVYGIRARWLGHQLTANLDVVLSGDRSLSQADRVANDVERELKDHLPALSSVHIRVMSATE